MAGDAVDRPLRGHRERLRRSAEEVARTCAACPTVREVALCGAPCMDDPCPPDASCHAREAFASHPEPASTGFACRRKRCREPRRLRERGAGIPGEGGPDP